MMLGYARVSTDDQSLDLQKSALLHAGVAEGAIYDEHISGVKAVRPALAECLKALREGDLLVVWRLDRLGRSVPELIKILDDLQTRGIGFKSLSESIDTTTAAGKMIFHMLAAFAEFERNLISERTKAGMRAARARGYRGGRPPKLKPAQVRAALQMLKDPLVTHKDVAEILKCSRATLYREFKKMREKGEMEETTKAVVSRKWRMAAEPKERKRGRRDTETPFDLVN